MWNSPPCTTLPETAGHSARKGSALRRERSSESSNIELTLTQVGLLNGTCTHTNLRLLTSGFINAPGASSTTSRAATAPGSLGESMSSSSLASTSPILLRLRGENGAKSLSSKRDPSLPKLKERLIARPPIRPRSGAERRSTASSCSMSARISGDGLRMGLDLGEIAREGGVFGPRGVAAGAEWAACPAEHESIGDAGDGTSPALDRASRIPSAFWTVMRFGAAGGTRAVSLALSASGVRPRCRDALSSSGLPSTSFSRSLRHSSGPLVRNSLSGTLVLHARTIG